MSVPLRSSSSREVRLPPNRFYWGVLDPGVLPRSWPRSSPGREQLGYLFESVLPTPVDSVHAVYQRLPDRRVLACGMDRRELSRLTGAAITLGPLGPPAFLREELGVGEGRIAESMNLLTREFEPTELRRGRRHWLAQLAALAAVCLLLLAVGMERRARASLAGSVSTRAVIDGVYDAAIGPRGASSQPAPARMLAELRRLRKAADATDETQRPRDASLVLAHLLEAWPPGLDVQTQSLRVTGEQVIISANLRDGASAEHLENALAEIEGWSVGQRTLRRSRDDLELRLPLVREKGDDS